MALSTEINTIPCMPIDFMQSTQSTYVCTFWIPYILNYFCKQDCLSIEKAENENTPNE